VLKFTTVFIVIFCVILLIFCSILFARKNITTLWLNFATKSVGNRFPLFFVVKSLPIVTSNFVENYYNWE